MNYRKLDEFIKKVEEYNSQEAYYTYRDDNHYICDNDGSTMYLNDNEMSASSLDELLKLGRKTYKRGQLFELKCGVVLLAQVSYDKYCPIDVKTGNRMNEGVSVNNYYAITEKELELMTNNTKDLVPINSLKDA